MISRGIKKPSRRGRGSRSLIKTLLLQNQQIIIQQQNMMLMLMRQQSQQAQSQSQSQQQQQHQHQASSQQSYQSEQAQHQDNTQPFHLDEATGSQQQSQPQHQPQSQQQPQSQPQQQQQHHLHQHQQQHQQPPQSQEPLDADSCAQSTLLGGDAFMANNLVYNPYTDFGSITPYKNGNASNGQNCPSSQQAHQHETPSYYSSGCESLTTPRVEQQRRVTPATIDQNVVKNLNEAFKSPSKPKISVQILSDSATREMKTNKAKIIQSMNISEFLHQVHNKKCDA